MKSLLASRPRPPVSISLINIGLFRYQSRAEVLEQDVELLQFAETRGGCRGRRSAAAFRPQDLAVLRFWR